MPCRETRPGDVLEVLVLAVARRSCVAVDLASGAFVRINEPSSPEIALEPFDVARGRAKVAFSELENEQPEYVAVDAPLKRIGALKPRAAEKYLKPLLHPSSNPILGLLGPSAPWWELAGHQTVALIEPESRPMLTNDARGLRCSFQWSRQKQWLPVADARLLQRLPRTPRHPSGAAHIEDILGFRPERVVVTLTPPRGSQCHKVASGFLPR